MQLHRLHLEDFRNYRTADGEFAPGLTAILGENGQGKTNLIEAIAYLATLSSMRGAPSDALVRAGADRAIIRATGERDGRDLLIEAEIGGRRPTVQINRQRLKRTRDLLGALRVVVFSPDDLALIKDGPSHRRAYLDDVLVAVHTKYDARRSEVDKILRQRNALLRQASGRLDADTALTLDVWDDRFATAGEALVSARVNLLDRLRPLLSVAYDEVASEPAHVTVDYVADWREGGLAAALEASRTVDLRRGVTTVGPHRDDLAIAIGDLASRTHASQGEQRSLALALRLAAHRVITEVTESAPLLLLDDVFSELDPVRSGALLEHLPADAQTVLTSASGLPEGADPDRIIEVTSGTLAG